MIEKRWVFYRICSRTVTGCLVGTSFLVRTLCNMIIMKNQVVYSVAYALGVIAYSWKSVICIEGVLRLCFRCGSELKCVNNFRNWFVRYGLVLPLDNELTFGVEVSSA
jgi:hypothetical protein